MHFLIGLLVFLTLASCGSPSATTTSAPPARVQATITNDDRLLAEDIGALVIGSTISVPALHELQIAAVFHRDGAFASAASFITCSVSNNQQQEPCRIVVFQAKGPLRPDAADTLVLINGRPLRWTGVTLGSMRGHEGHTLMPGNPFVPVVYVVYGKPGLGSVSSDIKHSENVALSVHLFVRIVALTPDDPRYAKLQESTGTSNNGSMTRELPIPRIEALFTNETRETQRGSSAF